MSRRSILFFILFIIICLSLTLRFYRLGVESFWADEGFSYHLASGTLVDLVEETSRDLHPPLYYLILYAWGRVFGFSDVSLRSPSCLFGIFSVVVVFGIGCIVSNGSTGLVAAFLTAVSPFLIYYSREARMYQLLVLLSLLSTQSLLKYLRDRTFLYLPLYCFFIVLAMFTHYMSFLLLFSHICFLSTMILSGKIDRTSCKHLLVGMIFIGICFLPWLPVFIQQVSHPSRLGQLSMSISSISVPIFNLVENLNFFHGFKAPSSLMIHATLIIPFIIGLYTWNRTKPYSGLILFIFFVSMTVPLVTAFYRNWFSPKFLIILFPMYYLVVGHGIVNMHKIFFVIILVVITWGSIQKFDVLYDGQSKEQFRDAVQYVNSHAGESDIVCIHSPYIRGAVAAYLKPRFPLFDLPESSLANARNFIGRKLEKLDNVWLIVAYPGLPRLYRGLVNSPVLGDRTAGYGDLSLRKMYRGVQLYRFSRQMTVSCPSLVIDPGECTISFNENDCFLLRNTARTTVPFKTNSATYHIEILMHESESGCPPLTVSLDETIYPSSETCRCQPILCHQPVNLDAGYHFFSFKFSRELKPVLADQDSPRVKTRSRPANPERGISLRDGNLVITDGFNYWYLGGIRISSFEPGSGE